MPRPISSLPRLGPTRRALLHSLLAAPLAAACSARRPDSGAPAVATAPDRAAPPRVREPSPARFDVIEAPIHLGLQPPKPGVEPGTWRAPAVLMRAGLGEKLRADRHVQLQRRPYRVDAVAGTRIRNGVALREAGLEIAGEVERSLARGAVPVVVGGDCSVMLGCLVGLRRAGGRGLVHVDGHADFFHAANYDTTAHLGAASGMDLALATGRGEPILTAWPGLPAPLVADDDVVQIGERGASGPGYAYPDIKATAITMITVQALHADGLAAITERALARLAERQIARAWLHVDLDVLDQEVMPAVDAPGSPGLDYRELSELLRGLVASRRIAGLDVTIYDPDVDPTGRHAGPIVDALAAGLRDWPAA